MRFYNPTSGRYIIADPIGIEGGINLYIYVLNNSINWFDPLGLDTYRQNRVLTALDGSGGTATKAPATHTFIYTTNADGTLKHTYSWGNKYVDGKGIWLKDQAEDKQAARQAIANSKVRGKKIGDASFDDCIDKVFHEWRDDPNHSSRHANWVFFLSCKTEATKLEEAAKNLQNQAKNVK